MRREGNEYTYIINNNNNNNNKNNNNRKQVADCNCGPMGTTVTD
jgi:hypothetical protein